MVARDGKMGDGGGEVYRKKEGEGGGGILNNRIIDIKIFRNNKIHWEQQPALKEPDQGVQQKTYNNVAYAYCHKVAMI